MKKRILSLLLAVVMVFGLLPMTVFAADAPTTLQVVPADSRLVIGRYNSGVASDPIFVPYPNDESVSFKLKAVASPDGADASVTWKSNNSAYTIDEEGNVTAAIPTSRQYVTFTATSTANPAVTGKVSVEMFPRLSITNNYATYAMPENGMLDRGRYVMTNPQNYETYHLVEWTVDDDSVLTIDNSGGNVCYYHPKKAGTATLTVRLLSNPAVTASTTVTITGILIHTEDGVSGETTMTLDNTLRLLVDTEDEVVWASSDEEVLTVENGIVTAKKEGLATVTAVAGGAKSSIKINVHEDGKLYADMIYTSSYSSMYYDPAFTNQCKSESRYMPNATYTTNGLFFGTAEFGPHQFYLKEGTSAQNLSFTTYYDTTAMKAVALQDGEWLADVKSGASYSFKAYPGKNNFAIRLISLTDETNTSDYIFNFDRAYSTTADLSAITMAPADRLANSAFYIKAKPECTLFRMSGGNVTATSGFAAAATDYTAYVCSDASAVKLTLKTKDTLSGHLRYSIDNGETWITGSATTATEPITLGDDGKAAVLVQSTSDAAVRAAAETGADPYENAKTYTVYVERISQEMMDNTYVKTLNFGEGTSECTPNFAPDRPMAAALVGHEQNTIQVTFTTKPGLNVYLNTGTSHLSSVNISPSYMVEPVGQTEDGDDIYHIDMDTPLTDNFNQLSSGITVSTTDETGFEVRRFYTLYYFKVGTTAGVLDGMPDAVADYWCVGSQYTNGGNNGWGIYGLFPEKTMNSTGNWNSCISCGNFGGYITFYYENGIVDDERNPYGVDFTVFGNSNNGPSFTEPGAVLVSEDGQTWYTLAGSEHYNNTSEWNYTVTYKQTVPGGIADYEDNFGHSESIGPAFAPSQFPNPSLYPLHTFTSEDPTKSDTVTALRLYGPAAKPGCGIEMGGNACLPAWGYVDVHTNSSTTAGTGENVNLLLTPVGNPYTADYNGYGDGFDLKWAVDADGMPVDVSEMSFHYVKVQTASFINGGAIGEKSTEVGCMVRTKPAAESVGTTAAPTIIVGGSKLELVEGKSVYTACVDSIDNYDVVVEASADANVYINNTRTASQTFHGLADKGIIRVVVQEGEKAPVLYYLTVATKVDVQITAQAANSFLVAPGTYTVSSNLAEHYGMNDAMEDASVSALDVLVRAHELVFGEDFTPETVSDFLKVSEAGYITTIFGEDTGNCGFTVNRGIPNDGTEAEWGGYNGLTVAQAPIVSGDLVEFFLYQDGWAMDNYIWYVQNGVPTYDLTAEANVPTEIGVKGYCIGWYGYMYKDFGEVLTNAISAAIEDAQFALVDTETGALTVIANAKTDGSGNASIRVKQPGEYLLTAYVSEEDVADSYDTPAVMTIAKLTVTDHTHVYTESVIEPTCTTEGYTEFICEACGHSYREDFTAALGHSDCDTDEDYVPATCTEDGHYANTVCLICGEIVEPGQVIPALGHDYVDAVVEPTCESIGYTTHTCSRCDDCRVDCLTPALGHSYEAVVTEATCDKMGYTTHTCTTCGEAYIDSFVDALEHAYAAEVTKESTCTEEGELTFTCSVCGSSYTQVTPKAEHSMTETVVDPTCVGFGYTEYKCANCDYSYVASIVQPTGHTYELVNAKDATCTEDGYTGDMVCSTCGDVKSTGEATPALGHTWGEWETTVAAACFADGEEVRSCSVCESSETRVIPANNDNCPANAFTDVKAGSWYHEGVDYVLTNGLMVGTAADKFSPNKTLTRAQLITVLYRMAGEPEVTGENVFTDVKAGSWYETAVIWAAESNITSGSGNGTFSPNADITRQDMVVMMYRYAKLKGMDTTASGELDYPDADKVAAYAKDAMIWAVSNGLISGTKSGSETVLDPKGTTTRAQLAVVIMRFATKIAD